MCDASAGLGDPSVPRTPLWEVYADLCETAAFQRHVPWTLHRLVVRHLVLADCRQRAALELYGLVAHPLFAAASDEGRRCALADPRAALRLLGRGPLPDARLRRREADALAARHLSGVPAVVRHRLHRWVLRRAETLERAFFEPRPGSRAGEPWGKRYTASGGGDWYQRCLGTMSKATARRVCRGDLDALDPEEPIAACQSRSR